jgi:formiminotetrahydrofolate cyclodeaminase
MPVRDLIDAFASSSPAPGGGSAAALASAVGTALLCMVAALPKTRTGADDERAALDAVRPQLEKLRAGLQHAIDADTRAYEEVIAAYRLPKTSAAEQDARRAAIGRAMQAATEAPRITVRLSLEALEHAVTIAAHGHRAAWSDLGVGVRLLEAGAAGASMNVAANLGSLKDAAYVDTVRAEMAALVARAGAIAKEITTALTAA